MVSDLIVDQLALVVLVCLCVMIHVVWPNECRTDGHTPATPIPSPRQRSRAAKPFAGLTHKPPRAACAEGAGRPPRSLLLLLHPHGITSTRGRKRPRPIPRSISVRIRIVCIGPGRGCGICAPTAILVGANGGSCCASPVAATFWSPLARCFTASAHLSNSSCASLRAWPRG